MTIEVFSPPFFVRNRDLQTILPALFRKPVVLKGSPGRISTPDGDFLDIEWFERHKQRRVAILSHGLEGSANAPYIRGMAHGLLGAGWNVLTWNFRGCSGEPNRKPYWYHSGKSDDLAVIVDHVLAKNHYDNIVLIGFSVGGNITLKYLGELGRSVSPHLLGAAVCSVPIDLEGCAAALARPRNAIYMRRFLRLLIQKILEKNERFPKEIHTQDLSSMKTFYDFDNRYTAPLNGFRDASDYWSKSSSASFLSEIQVPTLFVSALDDPFLSSSCFPRSEDISSDVRLCLSDRGGHVGFMMDYKLKNFWFEKQTIRFLNEISPRKSYD
ncbi:MAG: alpha/beta fold hydrolase [Bdellovibrionales bacterium]|nr:alpha/beta fold hydrolase [Bdellovibrionales bacterium]